MVDHADPAPDGAHILISRQPGSENQFLTTWDRDIKRASFAGANGDQADADDYAQEARIRVTTAMRSKPGMPAPYIRTVISNAVKTARRRAAHPFSVKSPMAEETNDNLRGADPDQDHDLAVALWIETLPQVMQRLYQHLYQDNRSQRETARLMNVSQPRIAQLHSQLLKRGRQELLNLAA